MKSMTDSDSVLSSAAIAGKGPPSFIDRTKSITFAIVIHVYEKKPSQVDGELKRSVDASLEEALGLANAIDLDVRYSRAVPVGKIHPSTYIGSGTLEELSNIVKLESIKLAIFDTTLTPVQQRNLEKQLQCKVIDRTGLILEIFGARARTREGKLQVDLAFLKHRRSRLVRAWTHLERQRGGFGFTGGPGESQMELDRRMIDTKIMKLEKELEQVKRTRSLHRKKRQRHDVPLIALVGYTNAGKSTLFNYLTKADVFAKDLLFATLDPTIRPIKLPNGREVLLSDTVGFISNLPTQLVAAFRATLEEVKDASVILHVRDCSNAEHEVQKQAVIEVLEQLEVDYDTQFTKPAVIDVFNKVDLISNENTVALENLANREGDIASVSAITGVGIESLLLKIQHALKEEHQQYTLKLPANGGAFLAWCYRQGVIEKRDDIEEGCILNLNLTEKQYKYIIDHFALQGRLQKISIHS